MFLLTSQDFYRLLLYKTWVAPNEVNQFVGQSPRGHESSSVQEKSNQPASDCGSARLNRSHRPVKSKAAPESHDFGETRDV